MCSPTSPTNAPSYQPFVIDSSVLGNESVHSSIVSGSIDDTITEHSSYPSSVASSVEAPSYSDCTSTNSESSVDLASSFGEPSASAFLSIHSSPPSARNCATSSDDAPTTIDTITTPGPSWKRLQVGWG